MSGPEQRIQGGNTTPKVVDFAELYNYSQENPDEGFLQLAADRLSVRDVFDSFNATVQLGADSKNLHTPEELVFDNGAAVGELSEVTEFPSYMSDILDPYFAKGHVTPRHVIARSIGPDVKRSKNFEDAIAIIRKKLAAEHVIDCLVTGIAEAPTIEAFEWGVKQLTDSDSVKSFYLWAGSYRLATLEKAQSEAKPDTVLARQAQAFVDRNPDQAEAAGSTVAAALIDLKEQKRIKGYTGLYSQFQEGAQSYPSFMQRYYTQMRQAEGLSAVQKDLSPAHLLAFTIMTRFEQGGRTPAIQNSITDFIANTGLSVQDFTAFQALGDLFINYPPDIESNYQSDVGPLAFESIALARLLVRQFAKTTNVKGKVVPANTAAIVDSVLNKDGVPRDLDSILKLGRVVTTLSIQPPEGKEQAEPTCEIEDEIGELTDYRDLPRVIDRLLYVARPFESVFLKADSADLVRTKGMLRYYDRIARAARWAAHVGVDKRQDRRPYALGDWLIRYPDIDKRTAAHFVKLDNRTPDSRRNVEHEHDEKYPRSLFVIAR